MRRLIHAAEVMSFKNRYAHVFSLMVVLAGSSAPLMAQESSARQEALAEALFQDGRKLMEERRFEEACPKLAESHTLDPAGGTVLLLALCYEQVGKTASAWVKFNEAIAVARRDGRSDRVERASLHIQKLEPTLSRIVVSVPPEVASLAGVEVLIDGVPLPPVAWSRALPFDPGSHRIEARASGKKSWTTTIDLGASAARVSVDVPLLEDLLEQQEVVPHELERQPERQAFPMPQRDEAEPSSTSFLPYLVGGLGVVALSFGGYYGVRALDRNASARDHCPENECTNPMGVQLNEDARRDAMRANVLAGAGLVLGGTAAYLFFATKQESRGGTAAVVQPVAGGLTIGTTTHW